MEFGGADYTFYFYRCSLIVNQTFVFLLLYKYIYINSKRQWPLEGDSTGFKKESGCM